MEPTLSHLFQRGVRVGPRSDLFRYWRDGRYVDVSSAEADRAVRELSQGLVEHGVAPGDRVAILSENRIEWALTDLAALGARAVVVPLYATLLAEQIRRQLSDSQPVCVLCSTREQVEKIATIRDRLPCIRFVVSFEPSTLPGTLSLESLRERGRESDSFDAYDARIAQVTPDDVATILYTSGTTGEPKGVMLTHRNIVFNVDAGVKALGVSEADRCLSFLPLSHILERTAGHFAMLYAGVSIAYARSVETIADDMLQVHPSMVVSVPRLFEKIEARMRATASASWFRRRIFGWARKTGIAFAQRDIAGVPPGRSLMLHMWLADRLVFRKLRARTGNRLRFFLSGGAPLAKDLAEFFYAARLPILEGYGLTETSPVITVNTFQHLRPGTVGMPVPGIDVRIAPDGEILTRSPSVMKGYYNKPADTAEALRDGWFHTGDLGEMDSEGFLRITGRKKDLIVTSGGKNVAPQPIESALQTDPLIDQVALVGDQRHYVVALIVPHFGNLRPWARRNGIAFRNDADLARHEAVRERIERSIERTNASLAGFERVKRFAILEREFSQESGELTPTLKLKRREIESKHADVIEKLYAEK